MKLTNWKKHLFGGVLLCLFYAGIVNFGVIFTVLGGVLVWELGQMLYFVFREECLQHRTKWYQWFSVYLRLKWLDCLVDMFMGVLGFTTLFIILSILGLLPVTVIW
jgi:hypothetical protein